MRKVASDSEMLSGAIQPEGKTIIDIGCGTGSLARWMNSQGGYAIGMDMPEMLAKIVNSSSMKNDRYIAGLA
jgi:2-polyprenyl-3-methyl-5-hydroxy-6-metoxy-1,4-benzoquinol methylase